LPKRRDTQAVMMITIGFGAGGGEAGKAREAQRRQRSPPRGPQ
jgi:hypothetical protein